MALKEYNVPFTINTDGPEMQLISLRKEFEKMVRENILTPDYLLKSNQIAHEASFIQESRLQNSDCVGALQCKNSSNPMIESFFLAQSRSPK